MSVSEEFWMSDKAAKNFAALEQQRDELLAALEGFVEWALDETIPTREAMLPALAAIAKVKGEKHENL